MANLQIKKVNTLPVTLESKTIYIVNSQTDGYAEIHVSDKDGASSYRLPTMTDVENELNTMFSLTASPNKMPAVGIDGKLDSTWVNPLPTITSASLHQSPNPITAMFIYDTTKDSDGGAWTDKCQHTSWYNETLCGKWLGAQASESAARTITGATTNDYFQLTTDGKFYKLNAGSGTTEVFRGNKANFPKIAGLVAENSNQILTIYDLTEPNCPMWMTFVSTNPSHEDLAFIVFGAYINSIYSLNGYVGLSTTGLNRMCLINFIEDWYEKIRINKARNISKRNTVGNSFLGTHGYNNFTYDSGVFNGVSMFIPNKNVMTSGLPRPIIVYTSDDSGTGGRLYVIYSNKNISKNTEWITNNNPSVNSRLLLLGSNTNSNLYYAINPTTLSTTFTLTTVTSTTAPYFNDALTTKLKQMTVGRYLLHGRQNSVRQLLANVNTYAKSLTTRITNNEQTGWLVGDIRRCYMGDDQVSSMLTNTLMPPISNAKLVQRLGSENFVVSLLSLGNGIVLAGTASTGQIYRSTDNGLSFTLVQRLGSENYAWSLLSLGNGIVLAGTGDTGQIYRSTDNGLSFTLVQRLGSESRVYSLLSLGNGVILAGTAYTGQLYRSTDNGLSFTLVQRLGGENYVLSLLSLGNGIVLASTAGIGQIYRSTDNGLSFTLVQRLGSESRVYSLLSLGNGIVLAGTGTTGQIYRSTDNGLSFTLVQRLGTETFVWSLLSLGNGIVLAGTYPTGQIYRYTFPVISGTLTKTPVAPNADLTAYSGFSNTNYVKEAYSSDLDFGTAEWSISAWIKIPSANAAIGTILYRGYSSGPYIALTVTAANYLSAIAHDGTTTRTVTSVNAYNLDTWIKVRANYRTDGSLSLSVNGVEEATTYGTPLLTLNNANAVLTLGNNYALDAPFPGSLCLVKLSATVPTPDQMAFMFAEESQLFRDNAQCTLPDASGIVDLTYDDETDTWTSVSATYKAEWNDLVRTKSSALTSGTYAKVESRSGIALETIYDTGYKVNASLPYRNIKGKLALRNYKTDIAMFDYAGGFTATTTNGSTSITSISGMSIPPETTHYEAIISGTGITTDTQLYSIVGTTGYLSKPATANGTAVQIAFRDFILPVGYTVVEVYSQGVKKQEGTSKDYTRLFDGFRETIRFGTAPGYNAWIQIHALPQT